jgi:hypothetical protein
MHPKGKVVYDQHHHADKNKEKMIHIAALVSAIIATAFFVLI